MNLEAHCSVYMTELQFESLNIYLLMSKYDFVMLVMLNV